VNSFLWPLLTRKETRVAELLLEGCENKDIGRAMGIKSRTIKGHLHRMFEKCGLKDADRIKRVCLAVALYREQQEAEEQNPLN
jgi:DNA-binding NarL/FixJ family response regulator